ncbi:hypothetical protein [Streptomyces sp. NPDC001919]
MHPNQPVPRAPRPTRSGMLAMGVGAGLAMTPWAYTGDPEEQFVRFREGLGVR